MMDAIANGISEAHGIMGKYNPSDNLTKGLDGSTTTLQRQDMLGIKLMDKYKGVTIPRKFKFKPVLSMSSYQVIMGMYKDTNWTKTIELGDDVWWTME